MKNNFGFFYATIILLLSIILVVVITKEPVIHVDSPLPPENISSDRNFELVNIGDNRIAVMDSDINYGNMGEVTILELDVENQTLTKIAEYNISQAYTE